MMTGRDVDVGEVLPGLATSLTVLVAVFLAGMIILFLRTVVGFINDTGELFVV